MLKKILCLSVLLPSIANAGVSIPDVIKVPSGHHPMLTAHAKGEQIYQCALSGGVYSWQIQAPDAQLFDAQGQIIGKHYEGPVWEYKEGSRVQGKITGKFDMSPGSAITWLLVEIIGHKGDGPFSKTSYINRINTQRGLPPVTGCDGNHLGQEKRIAYSADYIFYQPD
ncbi:MAG: DUF3455 domain-containing protein [Methylovulum sp.]|nr:DUF3455 domain-containing protein [Methylovulum sp.]